jgi:hypothetical protein
MLHQPGLSTERCLNGQLVYWYPVVCSVADLDPGILAYEYAIRIRDPGWKKI